MHIHSAMFLSSVALGAMLAGGCGRNNPADDAGTTGDNQTDARRPPPFDPWTPPGGDDPDDPGDPGEAETSVSVRLVPQSGVSGLQRVNFAVPLPAAMMEDPDRVRVYAGDSELPVARRPLATYPDGSVRSVHLQFDLDIAGETDVLVTLGGPGGPSLERVPVSSTLGNDGTPRVWALLPTSWLVDSGFAGPAVAASEVANTQLDAWINVCDYGRWDTDDFLSKSGSRGSWLYDRVTVMYRGHQRTGSLAPLRSAHREAHIYRNGISGTGTSTRIGVPTAANDLKYHYTQGMALHYLMTGDDRFRESVEDVATRAAALWTSPGYAGGSDFWTERHAGFALLAYEWAARVSDDQAATFAAHAEAAVGAYLSVQQTYPPGYSNTERRCFAHRGSAHGEAYGGFGCSPWMSAILAEGLSAYASRVGGAAGDQVRQSLVKLGRAVAYNGRDGSGKPYYWMAVDSGSNDSDPYEEHWGESAYLAAMAWHYDGRTDDDLRSQALALVAGLRNRGVAGQIRSFNWQCRGATMAQWYLK